MHTLSYSLCSVVFLLTLPNGLTGIKQITIKNAVVSASSNLGGIAEAGKLSQEKGNEILPSSNVTGKITFVNASVPPTNQNVETQLKKGNSTVSIENVQLLNSENTKGTSSINMTATPATGVAHNISISSTIKSHTATKPQITEHDYEFIKTELKSEAKYDVPNIPSADKLQKNSKRANYVIPIVAVILSVPLVAVIISAIYKRGADWWQHRNYRRMDFLIEGMYNN